MSREQEKSEKPCFVDVAALNIAIVGCPITYNVNDDYVSN